MVMSAVSSVSTPGVLVTMMPRTRAVSRSMLSTPLPKLAISLSCGPGLGDQRAVDAVGDGGHQHVRRLDRLGQLGLAHGLVVDVEARVEQLAHARFDGLRQLARDDHQGFLGGCRHGNTSSSEVWTSWPGRRRAIGWALSNRYRGDDKTELNGPCPLAQRCDGSRRQADLIAPAKSCFGRENAHGLAPTRRCCRLRPSMAVAACVRRPRCPGRWRLPEARRRRPRMRPRPRRAPAA